METKRPFTPNPASNVEYLIHTGASVGYTDVLAGKVTVFKSQIS